MALYFYSMKILFTPQKHFFSTNKDCFRTCHEVDVEGCMSVLLSMVCQPQLLKLPQKANYEGRGQKSEKAVCEMNESEIQFWI